MSGRIFDIDEPAASSPVSAAPQSVADGSSRPVIVEPVPSLEPEPQIYLARSGGTHGPYTVAQIESWLRLNQVFPTDRACAAPLMVWKPIDNLLADLGSKPAIGRLKTQRRQKLIGLSIALGVIAFIVIASIVGERTRSTNPVTARSSAPAQPTVAENITSKQRLERARGLLENGYASHALADLAYIGPKDVEFAEAKKLKSRAEALEREKERREAPALRAQLLASYEQMLTRSNPHLNYIRMKTTSMKGGYALWGTHPYFTQYTFSIGNDGPNVSSWIAANRSDLVKAQVVRVGVKSSDGWGGSCWFDV